MCDERMDKAFFKRAIFQQFERLNTTLNKFNTYLDRIETEQQQHRAPNPWRQLRRTPRQVDEEMLRQLRLQNFPCRDDRGDATKQRSIVHDIKSGTLVPMNENESTLKREVKIEEEKRVVEKENECSKEMKEKEEKVIECEKNEIEKERHIESEGKTVNEKNKRDKMKIEKEDLKLQTADYFVNQSFPIVTNSLLQETSQDFVSSHHLQIQVLEHTNFVTNNMVDSRTNLLKERGNDAIQNKWSKSLIKVVFGQIKRPNSNKTKVKFVWSHKHNWANPIVCFRIHDSNLTNLESNFVFDPGRI